LQLQGTAWSWLQKLRRCTIRQGREKLSGRIEVDEFFAGSQKSGKKGTAVPRQDPCRCGSRRLKSGKANEAHSPVLSVRLLGIFLQDDCRRFHGKVTNALRTTSTTMIKETKAVPMIMKTYIVCIW
jgi:hypothetical protein